MSGIGWRYVDGTAGSSIAAPVTARTLSSDMDTSATTICHSARPAALPSAAPLSVSDVASVADLISRHNFQPTHGNSAPPANSSPITCGRVVAMTAKPMRSTVTRAIPSHKARSRCAVGSPIAAIPTTTALSADSTTLTNTTCTSTPAAAASNKPANIGRYLGLAGAMKIGWSSSKSGCDCNSILTLLASTVVGASSRPVTMIGNAITKATMITCNPTQGSAPQ